MPTIGDVAELNLKIWQGQDLNFDIKWWADEAKTVGIDIASVVSRIKLKSATEELLDLAPYIEIDGTDLYTLHVSIPASATATLPLTSTIDLVWDLNMTAADSDEVRKIFGWVKVHEG